DTETADDRVKDRLGGWQDSETRKHLYQDRETQQLRAEAASVRRRLRLGPDAARPSAEPNESNGGPPVDLDALLELLSDEQRALLAARLNAPKTGSAAPRAAPKTKAPGAARSPTR